MRMFKTTRLVAVMISMVAPFQSVVGQSRPESNRAAGAERGATIHLTQNQDAQSAPRGGGRGPARLSELALVAKFDADGDGVLRGGERVLARESAREQRAGRRRRGGDALAIKPGQPVALNEAAGYAGLPLYDPSIVRTLFLEFTQPEWEAEMVDFYRTDVLIPASLMVDGQRYPEVGVSFRGNSSFFTVSPGQKRSLNLVIDLVDEDQSVGGFRTLNLLNAHTDPSFLREVMFNHVARNYLPAPRANFVRLVINGEDWGIYVNSQQVNKEFTEEWFGSRQGVRWKIRAGGGARSLNYLGDDLADYRPLYEAKSNASDQAWTDLVRLCRELDTVPVESLDTRLDRVLDVDRVLWFLAMDNVLIDSDGYYARGSDYLVYQEPRYGRFHLLNYDSNETFRYPGGGGPGGRSGISVEGVKLSPFAGEENSGRPLLHRLMANKRIRARYVAHVRTIVEEWLVSGRLEEKLSEYHRLIAPFVARDTKKLYSTTAFRANLTEDQGTGRRPTPGLKSFVAARREFLLELPELQQTPVRIEHVQRERYEQAPIAGQVVGIQATVDPAADELILYYSTDRLARFSATPMERLDERGQFRGEVPSMPAGSRVYYYVESRRGNDEPVSYFWPRNPVLGAASYRVVAAETKENSIVVNEVMPTNESTARDPQGDFDDWIELHNPTGEALNLTGMYLTDDLQNLRQWRFPRGAIIQPGGYLIVWADGDTDKTRGYHAGFKLSSNGETVILVDTDQRGNAVLDSVTYTTVGKDESFGRITGGELAVMPPTPGRKNK